MLYFHRRGLTAMHRQLLTQVAYTLPFSLNENPFPVTRTLTPTTGADVRKHFPSRSDWLLLLNYTSRSAAASLTLQKQSRASFFYTHISLASAVL